MEQSLTDVTMPKTFQGDTLVTSNLRWWCSGFFPGTAWYAYKLGGDTKELALRQTAKMLDVDILSDHHDIGFQVMCSAGLAWKETGDSLYLKTIRAAAIAASASTLFTDKATRPDFSILFYPVISMADEITHRGSKKNLLREAVSDPELVERFSLEKQVSADTPPTFITLCATDKVVPQENSIRYNDALKAHGVPCEMVVFPEGPHGFGFREGEADTIKPYRQQLYDALDKWLSRL